MILFRAVSTTFFRNSLYFWLIIITMVGTIAFCAILVVKCAIASSIMPYTSILFVTPSAWHRLRLQVLFRPSFLSTLLDFVPVARRYYGCRWWHYPGYSGRAHTGNVETGSLCDGFYYRCRRTLWHALCQYYACLFGAVSCFVITVMIRLLAVFSIGIYLVSADANGGSGFRPRTYIIVREKVMNCETISCRTCL